MGRRRAGLRRASITTEGFQMLVGFGLVAWILLGQLGTGNSAGLLLQIYWLLNLPALGYELALIAREYPAYRTPFFDCWSRSVRRTSARTNNTWALRPIPVSTEGVRIQHVASACDPQDTRFSKRSTSTSRRALTCAMVGASGAGKSSLLGLLLGWQRPARGRSARRRRVAHR
jgi:ATP-binding cassette subfamily B protein